MPNRIDTKIVLGSKKNQVSTNTDLLIELPLINTQKEMDEFDRNSTISLAQVFDDERQSSNIFRPVAKIDFLFYNAYSGITNIVPGVNYAPFTNSLYYVNTQTSFVTQLWSGYPQYYEFDLIRTDNGTVGYTVSTNTVAAHVDFVNKSASTYNWTQYISYPFEND
jgi:hypothetical protein